MKRIAWLTDIHLNFTTYIELVEYTNAILKQRPDTVVIGGDIGEANSVVEYLIELEKLLQVEICFVLGNHDYYKAGISDVRKRVSSLSQNSPRLTWLPEAEIVSLTPTVGLIGHGSWADGKLGDYERSDLLLNDHLLIKEFNPLLAQANVDSQYWNDRNDEDYPWMLTKEAKQRRLRTMQSLADEAARHYENVLPKAFETYEHVVLLTHVPPFKESCWFRGRISDDYWLPHFSCKAAGDVLYRAMKERPKQRLTVLCGHTHGSGKARILDNLQVLTGGATYGRPDVQQVFEFE